MRLPKNNIGFDTVEEWCDTCVPPFVTDIGDVARKCCEKFNIPDEQFEDVKLTIKNWVDEALN